MGEYDNTGALITEHIYLNDTPIAAIKTAGAYLIQADHLNTPRAILGAGNALVWKWDSDAFGTTAANENPSALGIFNYNPRFPGQYYDKESALHYHYFRDSYNPKTGRYFQSDPIGLAGGINTYGYVDSNPISKIDPMGLTPLPPDFDPNKPPATPKNPPTNPVRPPPEMPKPTPPKKPGMGCSAVFEACKKFADRCGSARLAVTGTCFAIWLACEVTGAAD